MKCLIFSDSHGDVLSLDRAIRTHRDAEVIFFLGDGLSDLDALNIPKDKMVLAVRGNCDFSGVYQNAFAGTLEKITLMGKTVVLTHGHLYGAKYGEGGLLRLAIEERADIVLYGHTHIPTEAFRYVLDPTDKIDGELPEERPVTLFNPGSVGSTSHSYGILTVTESTYLFSHANA